MIRLSEARRAIGNHVTEPTVRLLAKTPITPNALTWLGFLLSVGAAALVSTRHLLTAGLVMLIGGFLDTLDGGLARYTNRATSFGALLDSTLDRLSEAAVLLGILFLYAIEQRVAEVLLVGTTLIVSQTVSYIRARAEGLGMECQAGLFTRTERVLVLVLGLLLNQIVIALAIILIFSLITIGQRLLYSQQQTKVK